jgi:hypothetical protein
MAGFADPEQIAAGLHTRLWARAFVVAEQGSAAAPRFAFVSADIGLPSQAVRMEVARRLGARFPDGRYSLRNVGFSVTHAHAGPAGYFQYMLLQTASLGFVNQTFEAITGGIVEAIEQADASLQPGVLSLGEAVVEEGGYNRSPTSYLLNPAEERAQYGSDHDDTMVLLKLEQRPPSGGELEAVGMFNWFPVHPTNMNRSNTLVSADNKGLAANLFESWAATSAELHPRRRGNATRAAVPLVGAFAQAHQGDISPNVGEPGQGEPHAPSPRSSDTPVLSLNCHQRPALALLPRVWHRSGGALHRWAQRRPALRAPELHLPRRAGSAQVLMSGCARLPEITLPFHWFGARFLSRCCFTCPVWRSASRAARRPAARCTAAPAFWHSGSWRRPSAVRLQRAWWSARLNAPR